MTSECCMWAQRTGDTRVLEVGGGTKLILMDESRNRGGESIKTRVADKVTEHYRQVGHRGATLTSSGNTAIAFAAATRRCGLDLVVTMPEYVNDARRDAIREANPKAVLIHTPAAGGLDGAIAVGEREAAQRGLPYFDQFTDPLTVQAFASVAPELLRALPEGFEPSQVHVVASVGTGGTLCGIAESFEKRLGKPIERVAARNDGDPLLGTTRPGFRTHLEVGGRPYTEIFVSIEEILKRWRHLIDCSYAVGPTSALNVACAQRYIEERELPANAVVIAPLVDPLQRYRDTELYREAFLTDRWMSPAPRSCINAGCCAVAAGPMA